MILQDFEIISVLGKGKKSKVYLVQLKADRSRVYAMKSCSKKHMLEYA